MIERCYLCGIELLETSRGRKYCSNHGIIDKQEEVEEVKKTPSYIG